MSHSTILLIEDDDSIREITQELLESEGYGVSTAANGQAALENLAKMEPLPCLILLDLMMPVMDGLTMLEKLRLDPDYGKSAAVILLTNINDPDKVAQAK